MSKIIFKSIGVILLAFVVIALLSILTDFLLESIGVLPNPQKGLFETWAILLVLFYRGVYTILAGFIVGKLSPVKPLLHAGKLGIVGTTITILVKLQFLAFGWVLKFRGTGKTMKRMPAAKTMHLKNWGRNQCFEPQFFIEL